MDLYLSAVANALRQSAASRHASAEDTYYATNAGSFGFADRLASLADAVRIAIAAPHASSPAIRHA